MTIYLDPSPRPSVGLVTLPKPSLGTSAVALLSSSKKAPLRETSISPGSTSPNAPYWLKWSITKSALGTESSKVAYQLEEIYLPKDVELFESQPNKELMKTNKMSIISLIVVLKSVGPSVPSEAECETIIDLLSKVEALYAYISEVESDRNKFALAIPQLKDLWAALVRVLRQRAERAEDASRSLEK
ncbi:hypothetical protein NE237_016174 [Protea cynaroides]|uniref:Uncharacterized protein n=1 Tax=Protea cynaroides TaxID=273540 RepID=A0A9Q0KF82_9MAGN|nr:hypothetical protein NE237_016174 [Protea cynaroides]